MPQPHDLPEPQRKQATIIFADLSGFTAMSEVLDPEQVRESVNLCFQALSAAVYHYQGTIDKYIGDCVMAVFGVPVMHENDCERACCAALEMRQAVRDLASSFKGIATSPPELQLHIGINTGLVVAGSMGGIEQSQYTVMGDAVNLASRLCHEAEPGQIALGGSSWELVRHKFTATGPVFRSIKGKSDTVPVYFLQSRSVDDSAQRHSHVPMVGRAAEIALATEPMREACAGRGGILYITGEAGMGKSRLSSEMAVWANQNGMRTLAASAEPLDTIQAYSLWRQVLERLERVIPYPDLGKNAALTATLGLASPEFQLLSDVNRFDAIVLAWKDLLYSRQLEQPLLLILDDLQWADAQSLQLLDQLVDWVPGEAILICALARPEFRHSWDSRAWYRFIILRALSADDSAALVRAALGDRDPGGGASHQADVIGRADGNPFYLTELAYAVDRLGEAKLPLTIQGLILERIDALEKEARRILEVASVIGREFPNRLLVAVAEPERIDAEISRLQELEFVYRKEIAPELSYLFKHYLTQQATYESILIQRRKELHRKIGAAIEKEHKEGLERYYAVLAQHYEKAGDYQLAFEYYRRAGENVQESQSEAAALGLYERGESALRMLRSDRPNLKNKRKAYLRIVAIGGPAVVLVSGGLPLLLAYIGGEHPAIREVVRGIVRGIVGFALGISMVIFAAGRWSFMVYPDRVRIVSKRRTIDIPFDRIKEVRSVPYKHMYMFGPITMWRKLSVNCNPMYQGFGLGQSGILHGVRHVLRIESPHGWRRGYTLNMENPEAFLATLNRALDRYRTVRGARP